MQRTVVSFVAAALLVAAGVAFAKPVSHLGDYSYSVDLRPSPEAWCGWAQSFKPTFAVLKEVKIVLGNAAVVDAYAKVDLQRWDGSNYVFVAASNVSVIPAGLSEPETNNTSDATSFTFGSYIAVEPGVSYRLLIQYLGPEGSEMFGYISTPIDSNADYPDGHFWQFVWDASAGECYDNPLYDSDLLFKVTGSGKPK